ncbi:cytochrome P450 [Desarmillaria tabescens]|uniref:Cytochrome P450 n=1 Tax=Armillaria tabescens TaxID=1929756 RepID=A0AA39NQH1_ARMTA|nr:cytochrome P450 [Desarmillaria tabescens]KAK0469989.1 cytochrome P450 [Desarmillaria tabescens]
MNSLGTFGKKMLWAGTTSSTMLLVDIVVFLVAVAVAVKLYYRHSRNPLGLPSPPGPQPSFIPFVGNIPDMPTKDEWFKFTEWGKQYGPLMMLEIMGQKMCIINSAQVATDLLDTRSSIYSDRPPMVMVKELMGWNFNMGFQSYDSEYKKSRKLFHHGFNPRASDGYQPIQTRELTILLAKLLQSPERFDEHLRTTTGAIIMMIAFGYQTVENDEFVRIAEEAQLAMVSAARPGAYLVDFLPFLKYVPEWFPGTGFKRVAREGWELAQDLQDKPYAWAKKEFEEGRARPSFFTALMAAKGLSSDDTVEEANIIKKASAVMYATGADTILASVLTFFLAMLHAPQVQKVAQEELTRVIGNDRLPTFSDRDSLPYINCIVKETYRWEQGVHLSCFWAIYEITLTILVIPLGVPHRLMKDDVYQGYFIPEGTTMIVNQWGISHDETMYPDPMAFRPERFMHAPDVKDGGPREPNTIAFGWGRRICPGRFLAENSLWLHVATTLHCFNILPVTGSNGKAVIPPRDYTSGLASRPKPFPCHIRPRNADVVELIKHSVAGVEDQ